MKKLMMVVGMALAIAVAGCGKAKDSSAEEAESVSASAVAEKFVNAIIKQNPKEAVSCYRLGKDDKSEDIEKKLKGAGDEIDDKDLVAKAINETVISAREIKNGKWQTMEGATVIAQFNKGKDKKPNGMRVMLEKVGSSWKVTEFRKESDLDTSDNKEETSSKLAQKMPEKEYIMPAPKYAEKAYAEKAAEKKPAYGMPAKKADYGTSSKVREFESACHELAKFARQTGEKVDESDVQKEIDKFKTLSSAEQDKQLKEIKGILEMMKSANLKK